jgi:hypothetical protein
MTAGRVETGSRRGEIVGGGEGVLGDGRIRVGQNADERAQLLAFRVQAGEPLAHRRRALLVPEEGRLARFAVHAPPLERIGVEDPHRAGGERAGDRDAGRRDRGAHARPLVRPPRRRDERISDPARRTEIPLVGAPAEGAASPDRDRACANDPAPLPARGIALERGEELRHRREAVGRLVLQPAPDDGLEPGGNRGSGRGWPRSAEEGGEVGLQIGGRERGLAVEGAVEGHAEAELIAARVVAELESALG